MQNTTMWRTRTLFFVMVCGSGLGCGDDSGSDAGVGGAAAVSGGGAGGSSGQSGGSGASGRGSAGSGGMTAMCSEAAPTAPVVCGGQTCTAPTGFMMNMCIYPCCATVGAAQVCGAKSTNPMYATGCEPPAAPDPACPPIMSNGMTFQSCCNVAMGKCGIVSTVRPGCITTSTLIMLPATPMTCDGSDSGAADAGL